MRLRMPLLGNACRRDCDKLALSAYAAELSARAALLSPSQPWFVPLMSRSLSQQSVQRPLDERVQLGTADACLPIDTAEGGRGVALVAASWLGAILPEAAVQRFNFGFFRAASLLSAWDDLRTRLVSRVERRRRQKTRGAQEYG